MKFRHILALAALLFAAGANECRAAAGVQVCDNSTPPQCAPVDPVTGLKVQASVSGAASFTPASALTLTAGTSTSNVSLGSSTTVLVTNSGTVPVFVKFGTSGVTAALTDYPIFPNETRGFTVATNSYLAAISTIANQKLYIATGSGSPAGWGGSTGSGFPADVLTTGTLNSATLNAAFTVNLANGEGATGIKISGLTAAVSTLTLEGSNDNGTTWSAINEINNGSTAALGSTITADGQFGINTGGRTNIRLRVSVIGSGTITLAANASSVGSRVTLQAALPPGGNTIGKVIAPQYTPTNVITAITASTITAGPGSSTTRTKMFFETTTANSQPIYVCTNGQSGTCGATVFDFFFPAGAVMGQSFLDEATSGGAVYFYTTASGVSVFTRDLSPK